MNYSTIDNFCYMFWQMPPNLNAYWQNITRKQADTQLYQIYCQYINLLGRKNDIKEIEIPVQILEE